jgi:LPS sulfotransferase NodH
VYQHDDDYAQSVWVTKMARLAATRHRAAWVINADADELWWTNDLEDLHLVLGRVPSSTEALSVERHDFPPRPVDDGETWVDTMTYRWVSSTNVLGEPLPPKVCHRAAADVVVGQGNHVVRRNGRDLVTEHSADLSILHFPVRSAAQIDHKIAVGGAAYERSTQPQAAGETWRSLYRERDDRGLDDYFRGQLVDDDTLPELVATGEVVPDDRVRARLATVPKRVAAHPRIRSRLDAYAICTMARTGSTYLCDLLEATGVMGRPAEYLNPGAQERWREILGLDVDAPQPIYFDALVRQLGTPWFGIKGPPDIIAFAEHFGPHRLRYVHLTREDTLLQAISMYRARASGQWHSRPGDGGHEREVAAPPFDAEAILERKAHIDRLDARWNEWFAAKRLHPLRLTYEQVHADPVGAVRSIATLLDVEVPPDFEPEPRSLVQRDEITEEWRQRLRDGG